MFTLDFRPRALKGLIKAKREDKLKINSILDILKDGNWAELDLKKIKGIERGYRLRVSRWRVLFSLFSKEKRIEIIDIFLKKGRKDYMKRMKLLKK